MTASTAKATGVGRMLFSFRNMSRGPDLPPVVPLTPLYIFSTLAKIHCPCLVTSQSGHPPVLAFLSTRFFFLFFFPFLTLCTRTCAANLLPVNDASGSDSRWGLACHRSFETFLENAMSFYFFIFSRFLCWDLSLQSFFYVLNSPFHPAVIRAKRFPFLFSFSFFFFTFFVMNSVQSFFL